MVTQNDIDAVLSSFLFEVQIAKVENIESASSLIDCLAIELVTQVTDAVKEIPIRLFETEEFVNAVIEEQKFAITTISDAAKQIVSTGNGGERIRIYRTLINLLNNTLGVPNDPAPLM